MNFCTKRALLWCSRHIHYAYLILIAVGSQVLQVSYALPVPYEAVIANTNH